MINKANNSNNGNKNKIVSIILYCAMIIGLFWGYAFALKYYKSFNFVINEGVVGRGLTIIPLFFCLIYLFVFMMSNKFERLSKLYWYLFSVLTIMPLIVVYTMNGIASSKNVLILLYLMTAICIIGVYLVNKLDFKLPQFKITKKTFWILIIGFCIIGYGYIIYTLGLPTKILLAFKDEYAVRFIYREMAGRFDDYFVQWLGNVVNPFILAFLIYKKKYKFIFIPIALEVLLYGYTGYKSLFVTLILAPFFAEILRRGIAKRFLECVIALGIFAGILMGYLGKLSLYLFIIVRVFLWPSLIALEYYDFFWMYPKIKLSHSIFGHFFKNVYNMEPSFYMGSVYYGKPDMRLNVTWYGDAYMNFGILGIIVFAILLYFIIGVIKSVESKNIYLVSALLFGGVMSLFNGPILTTLLTNGLGLGLVIAYLLPENI